MNIDWVQLWFAIRTIGEIVIFAVFAVLIAAAVVINWLDGRRDRKRRRS